MLATGDRRSRHMESRKEEQTHEEQEQTHEEQKGGADRR
jgi:hypothetical protein